MHVHLVDGTYELFRYYFALPSHRTGAGEEAGALRGVLGSVVGLIEDGATHVGVATDHVIESFRNDMWPGYKTGAGVDVELLEQFGPLEDALTAMGVTVWPMVDREADDALASAATVCAADPAVERVIICTPDKDLGQCVEGTRVVQWDRRQDVVYDADAVHAKFGVAPESIPDWLGLVGDSADGFPGLSGWGKKSAAVVLDRYRHIEEIPADAADWDVSVRGAAKLAATLAADRDLALLFRDLATLRREPHVVPSAGALEWRGPRPEFATVAAALDLEPLLDRMTRITDRGGRHP
ncbi:MAG: flap endonuclease [Acidimicrobiia bacterium]|nr:flap endonuclease [Acidimicrobiia bacterium]